MTTEYDFEDKYPSSTSASDIQHDKWAESLKECPNCKEKTFDGSDCHSCGFDANCFDPNYD